MSGLTKAFVVLVTFLSVVLVALIVPFVANTQDYQHKYMDEQNAHKAAEERAMMTQNEIAAAAAGQANQIAQLTADKNTQIAANATLQGQLADAQAKTQLLDLENTQLKADQTRLSSAVSQAMAITDAQQAELKERRTQMSDQQLKLIQLTAQDNDLTAQVDTLTRGIHRSQEDKVRQDEEMAKLTAALDKLPQAQREQLMGTGVNGQTQPLVSGTPIRGSITAIHKDGGETFVQVNVGTKDGVQPNMKFWVQRNGKLLGTLVIAAVDTGSAVGRMTLIVQPDIAAGDSVLTASF